MRIRATRQARSLSQVPLPRVDPGNVREEWYRELVESAPDAAILVDRDGRILFVNAPTERLFGWTRQDLLGQRVEVLVPERLRARHVLQRDAYFTEPRVRPMSTHVELWGLRRDGTEFPVEISLAPVRTAAGLHVAASIRDVTERNAIAQELARSTRDLERKNHELRQFTSVASHDLKAPLRAIGGFAELLERRYQGKLDARADDYLARISRGVRSLQLLIDDLLAFSRAGHVEGPPEPTDLEAVMGEVRERLSATLEKAGAQLTCDPLPRVPGYRGQLVQLLQNLIANAVKFQKEGATPEVHVRARREASEWIVSVSDNGIGIPPEHRARIFEPFKRLHGSHEYEGTGIGLAICHRIVENHGGRIWVESEPGAGSTFLFTLPAAA